MARNHSIRIPLLGVSMFVMCMFARVRADAQNSPGNPSGGQLSDQGAMPTVQENTAPVSAADQRLIDPSSPTRDLLIPGIYVSQGVDTNASGVPGNASLQSLTRVLGSLALERLWKRQGFSLDYVGGGLFSNNISTSTGQAHELTVEHRILWRSGQLSLRDSFKFLPEGSFGDVAFGGSGGLIGLGQSDSSFGTGIGSSLSDFFGPGQFASLGQQPRITNLAMMDIIQELSGRSSLTLAVSYGQAHFLDSPTSTAGQLNEISQINSQQESAQVGYDHQINRRDQIGLVYGFQHFQYPLPVDADLMTHLVNVLYRHQISARIDLTIGGGPQATNVASPQLASHWTISGSGQASVRFRFSRGSLQLEAERYNTSGSGLLPGALSTIFKVTAAHMLGRNWSANADTGYMWNHSILPASAATSLRGYSYVYGGGGIRRQIGRNFGAFLSYQYNEQLYDSSFCTVNIACDRTTRLHTALIGLDWHPNPFRLN